MILERRAGHLRGPDPHVDGRIACVDEHQHRATPGRLPAHVGQRVVHGSHDPEGASPERRRRIGARQRMRASTPASASG